MNVEDLKNYFEENRSAILEDYYTFLRFKSISADPAFHDECLACSAWLQKKLHALDFTVSVIETKGKPIVLANRKGESDASHLLYYGHYDVQPADPIEKWDSQPFDPTEKDGAVYARGALDNKGQTHYFLTAVTALIASDALKNEVTILLEGEEEVGSPNLLEVLPEISSSLQADLLLVCDTDCFRAGLPTITMGLRGIASLEIQLRGPNRDLHSGTNGGLCKNPASEMARLIASLHDDSGAIAVEGYYDGIRAPTPEEQKCIEALAFSSEEYESEHGIAPSGGEKGIAALERLGFRPTIEVNGMYSGYIGAGGKTIIPATATVKISTRVAGSQDPATCLTRIKEHCKKHAPEDMELSFPEFDVGGIPFFMNASTPCIQKAKDLLQEIFEVEPALVWEGASIPVVASLSECTNKQSLLIGFGLARDNIHSPNESFELERYEQGLVYAGMALQRL